MARTTAFTHSCPEAPRQFTLMILAWLLLAGAYVEGDRQPGFLADFPNPVQVDVRLRDSISGSVIHSSVQEEKGNTTRHVDSITVELIPKDHHRPPTFVLDLVRNKDLVPHNFFSRRQEKGKHVTKYAHLYNDLHVDLCHYHGKVRDSSSSWAAISTCDNELRGTFQDATDLWHIEPHVFVNGSHTHFLLRTKDHYHSWENGGKFNGSRAKRSIYSNTKWERKPFFVPSSQSAETDIKGPWNANKRSRYVELLLVVDHQEYTKHGSDIRKIERICKDVANVMNAIYSPLNIYIALVGVVVWTEYDEITLSSNGDTTLTNFLHYRRERLVKDHPNDNAQLLTAIQFDGGVVGKALKGPMCTYEFSGGVSTWHSDVIGLLATTVAHEMGHNFGMEHDTEECECPDDRCIMAPASTTLKPTFWSSCSLEYLALAFEHGMDYCLRNKPKVLFDSPVCGNGFVETGEECDCGLKDHCDNPCCDATTCKLRSNATCATGECCDFATCRPKTPGEMCRRVEHECDLPEFCNGESEFCPTDVFKVDGTPCKVGQAYCFQGSCRTHSDQCKLLWGPSGKTSDSQCYDQNEKGSRHGNCGYNRLNSSYIQCTAEDVRCGMLHCTHLNERLEFGMETVAILSHSFISSGGKIIPCRTALVDLGLNDVDPGLAPEGASCGDGKMCVNQKCMPVDSLVIGPLSCKNNCNNHGICNSLGHCHCEIGYNPPDCVESGPGGSVDSGPASYPDSISVFMIFLYIFLILLPILLCILIIFYVRSKGGWRQVFMEGSKGIKKQKEGNLRLEISAPMHLQGPSTTSSPTHALLPRVESAEATSESERKSEDSPSFKSFKRPSFLANFTREKRKDSSASESGENPESKAEKKNLLQVLARSISIPSYIRSRGESSVKYEITVEHQQPRDETATTPLDSQTPPLSVEQDSSTTASEAAAAKAMTIPAPDIRNNPKLAFPHHSCYTSSGELKDFSAPIVYRNHKSTSSHHSKPAAPQPPPKPVLSQNNTKKDETANEPVVTSSATVTPKVSSPVTTTVQSLKSPFFSKSSTANTSPGTSGVKRLVKTPSLQETKPSDSKDTDQSLGDSTTSKTKTLPVSTSSFLRSLPKSSTLPLSSTITQKPEISKPIFQAATSNATSLISRAPSTGVSQSSILSKSEKQRDRLSKGVVFCEPLTLPSPTNPNTPPIIHQPTSGTAITTSSLASLTSSVSSLSKAKPLTIITPQWSEQPKAVTATVITSHVDDKTAKEQPKHAPMASPEHEPSSPESVRAKEPAPVAPRKSFREMEISGPILQSKIDYKAKLVPVCTSADTNSTQSTPVATSPTMSKASAQPPPVSPRGIFKSGNSPKKHVSEKDPVESKDSEKEDKSRGVPWRFGKRSSFKDSSKRESAPIKETTFTTSSTAGATPSPTDQLASSISKRPVSVAGSRVSKPSIPPPKPPEQPKKPDKPMVKPEVPQKPSSSPITSPVTSTTSAFAQPKGQAPSQPSRPTSIGTTDDLNSPQDEKFVTPTSSPSPLFSRKSPDSLSTSSSNDGGDLMKEILKEIAVNKEDDSIYSTLVRKKKNKDKDKPET